MAPPIKTLMYGNESGAEQPAGAVAEDDLPIVEEPGKIIAGRYEILSSLAEGGMGSVYVARQLDLNRSVALKVFGGSDEGLQERFRREAVALADISHPAVVEVHDFIGPSKATEGRAYLVMAFVPGNNLDDHLQSIPESHMAVGELVDLFLPVASAVVELHASGIIHRDLKPGNLVFAPRADGHSSIKLVDFGIAKRELEEGLTAAGFVLGTPAFMAPEAMVGAEKTPAGDVYALGATLFELATGEAPFGTGSTAEILRRSMTEDPVLPNHLKSTSFGALLVRMVARDKEHRPDALQVFRELEKIEHELYRPPSQSILPALDLEGDSSPEETAESGATSVPARPADSSGSDEIPLGESPLVTMAPPDRPDSASEEVDSDSDSDSDPDSDPDSVSVSATDRFPEPPPPARNWAKLFVLVVGPMVLLALAAGVWLRMEEIRGQEKNQANQGGSHEQRPTVMAPMRSAPMDPAPMRSAPMRSVPMAPAVVGPDSETLQKSCRKKEGAKKLHRQAGRAMRKPATYAFAERALQVVLVCKGSKRWRRRRAAQQLAQLYALMGRCGDSTRAWQDYLARLPRPPKNQKKRKRPPRPPQCPAPATAP
jgi:serine/threonine protein kinase